VLRPNWNVGIPPISGTGKKDFGLKNQKYQEKSCKINAEEKS
jgi:hypothetical protein